MYRTVQTLNLLSRRLLDADERAFLRPRKIEAAAIQHPVAAGLGFKVRVNALASGFVGVVWALLRKQNLMTRNILLFQHDPSDSKAVREALINSNDGQFQVEWV